MANKEQLSVLKQGVNTWNQWREEKPNEKIDLVDADFVDVDLVGVNFFNANLKGARLSWTNLSRAKLMKACLVQAHLERADLSHANLVNTNLNLSSLFYANLSDANLTNARLNHANLSDANLKDANLRGATLNYADLSNVNLRGSLLFFVQALNTKFNCSDLTGANIGDWHINSATNFNGANCDYIYRNLAGDRLPVNPDQIFQVGEFENWIKINAQAQQAIDLTFTEGIDWQAFFQSLTEVRRKYPDANVGLQAIEEKGTAFVIRLRTTPDADQSVIESTQKELYNIKLRLREAQGEIRVLREMSDVLKQLAGTAMSQPTNQTTIHAQRIGIQHSGSGDIKNFTQNIGNYLDEIGGLIQSLRETAQSFPVEQKEIIEGELEDLEHDIKTPENHQPKRIGRRLKGLLAAGAAVAGIAGSTVTGAVDLSKQANDFTGNVLELANKFGIELVQKKQADE